jgi:hypothetical protein
MPSKSESISSDVWAAEERVRLARSQAVRRRRRARTFVERSAEGGQYPSTRVSSRKRTLLELALELLHEVVDEAVVEVLTAGEYSTPLVHKYQGGWTQRARDFALREYLIDVFGRSVLPQEARRGHPSSLADDGCTKDA